MFYDHGMHLIKEWIKCQISSDAEKGVAQKQHRIKIVTYAISKAHLPDKLFMERVKQTIENFTVSNIKY